MTYHQIHLLDHNGNLGHNAVQPFDGAIIDLAVADISNIAAIPDRDYRAAAAATIHYQGRTFTYAYAADFDTNGFFTYREKVQTQPSQWAIARGLGLK